MIKFRLFITKMVWNRVLCPIWSFTINVLYWSVRFLRIKELKAKKESLLKLELQDMMSQFKWRADHFKDWVPWISTIVDDGLKDDCDGAAVLARWWWKEHGISSKLWNLYSPNLTIGHMVCITNNSNTNIQCVSNSEVLDLDPNNWQQDLFNRFDNTYSIVVEK